MRPRAPLFSKRLISHYSSSQLSLPQLPPQCISPTPHHSLATFLDHARRTSLSRTSSLYIGTRYEYLCLSALSRLSFRALARTGGRGDLGIDLLGQWALPTLPYDIPALVSCKANKGGVGPDVVREVEGTVARKGGVGILVGRKEATKGVREAVRRSAVAVVWVMVEEVDGVKADEEGRLLKEVEEAEKVPVGRVRQVLWNEKVEMMGAAGLGVGVRHFEGGAGKMEKEVYLTWKGRIWEPGADEARPKFGVLNGLEVAKVDMQTADASTYTEYEK